jgi:hypothetical protein
MVKFKLLEDLRCSLQVMSLLSVKIPVWEVCDDRNSARVELYADGVMARAPVRQEMKSVPQLTGADRTGRHLPLLSQSQSQKENAMQVQINTGHNIEGNEALAAQVRGIVKSALSRISEHITRVEVHLSDESSHKSTQNDKRCMMEARLEGRQPIAVTHQADTLDQAVEGATEKLVRLIESTLGRQRHQESSRTAASPWVD